MNIIITLDYNTSWGEKLFLRNGKKKCEMRYIYAGAWQIDIESINSNIYSFEVWKNNECIRKEWRGHVLPTINSKVLKIRTKWQDRPSDLPFYSSMFKDVVFRRKASVSAKKTTEGNVLISFLNPKIRPDQTIAITGSGDKFGNWTKFIALDDSDFPVWKATLNINEPIEYKFVILDKKSKAPLYWEEGINHFLAEVPQKNCVLSIEDLNPVFGTEAWKGAGVAVPVFSLKSEKSFGIGEFYDLKKLVDWAEITGQNIIQLLPGVEETFIDKLEDKLRQIRSITELLSGGFTPERIIELLYEDISAVEEEAEMSGAHVKKYVEDYEILEESEIEYKCNCTREKYYKGIITLGKNEILHILKEEGKIEAECHFCGKKYVFTEEDFKDIK